MSHLAELSLLNFPSLLSVLVVEGDTNHASAPLPGLGRLSDRRTPNV
jgi:hypothetical protein